MWNNRQANKWGAIKKKYTPISQGNNKNNIDKENGEEGTVDYEYRLFR